MFHGHIWAWLSEPEQEKHMVLTENTRSPSATHHKPIICDLLFCDYLFFRAGLCGCSTAS